MTTKRAGMEIIRYIIMARGQDEENNLHIFVLKNAKNDRILMDIPKGILLEPPLNEHEILEIRSADSFKVAFTRRAGSEEIKSILSEKNTGENKPSVSPAFIHASEIEANTILSGKNGGENTPALSQSFIDEERIEGKP